MKLTRQNYCRTHIAGVGIEGSLTEDLESLQKQISKSHKHLEKQQTIYLQGKLRLLTITNLPKYCVNLIIHVTDA